MLTEDVRNLPGNNNPVLCTDGKLGMLLIYPGAAGLCGVQVHGEEEHRWIAASDLATSADGALRQKDAPAMPPSSAQEDPAQFLLAIDWARRGGPFIAS